MHSPTGEDLFVVVEVVVVAVAEVSKLLLITEQMSLLLHLKGDDEQYPSKPIA